MTAHRAGSPLQSCFASARGMATALCCSLALATWAQTIKIPDFRQPPADPVALKSGEPCVDCGRILSIREVSTERSRNVPQAFQGGGQPGASTGPGGPNLVGAVIYLPLGGDATTTEKPFVGGVGTPEMKERFRESTYEITVRLDDGALRFVQRHDGSRYRVGDRVRLSGVNQIELVVD